MTIVREFLQNGQDFVDADGDVRSLADIEIPQEQKRERRGPSYRWLLGAGAVDLSELVEARIYGEGEALDISDAIAFLQESELQAELSVRPRIHGKTRIEHRGRSAQAYTRGQDILASVFGLDRNASDDQIALMALAVKLRKGENVLYASAQPQSQDEKWWAGLDWQQRAANDRPDEY